MKKNILKAIIFIAIVSFISCEQQENIQFDATTGQTLAQFVGTSSKVPVKPTIASAATIEVGVSTVSQSDRTISISVDATSTATSSQYVISDLVIPAGEYVGSFTVTGVFNELPAVGSRTVVLKLTGVSGTEAVIENDTYTVSIERFCDFDINTFVGTYTAVQGASTYTVTATAGPEPNTVRLSNIENRGANIDIIIGLTPDDLVVVIRDDLDNTIYNHPTFMNVDPGTISPNPSVFNQCSGDISIEYSACIPDGRCFGNRVIELTKQ